MADDTKTAANTPEPILGFFSNLLGWVDGFTKIKKFLRTRNAVRRGEKIFDLSSDDLKAKDLMGPLTFNVYESTLAGLPAAALGILLGLFFQDRPTSLQFVPGVSEFKKAVVTEAVKIAPKIGKTIQPFLPPFFLLIAAWSTAWGCLKKVDSSAAKRRRCRDAFLYYDGTYGLWVQAVLSLAISLLLVPLNYVLDDSNIPLVVGVTLLILSSLWQFYLINTKVPKLLFQDNGYDSKIYHIWTRNFWKRAPANGAPWSKYTFAVVLSGTAAWIAIVLILALQTLAAYAVAVCVIWLKFKITGRT